MRGGFGSLFLCHLCKDREPAVHFGTIKASRDKGVAGVADWQTIKTEYITTDTSYRKLAEKYGVSRVQIGTVGKEENWVELRRQHLDRTVTKTVAAVESAQVNRAKKMQAVADKLLLKIEALADRPGMAAKDVRALVAAVKDLKEIQGVKSDLDKQEQEARIAALRQKSMTGDGDDDDTGVILLPPRIGQEADDE